MQRVKCSSGGVLLFTLVNYAQPEQRRFPTIREVNTTCHKASTSILREISVLRESDALANQFVRSKRVSMGCVDVLNHHFVDADAFRELFEK